MKPKYHIVVSKSPDNNKTDKLLWYKIGVVFEKEGGKLIGLLESVPTNWNGWFILSTHIGKNKEEEPKPIPTEPLAVLDEIGKNATEKAIEEKEKKDVEDVPF